MAIAHLQQTQAHAKNWFIAKDINGDNIAQRLHTNVTTDDEKAKIPV